MEPKRITPRSPRAALEPEQVTLPTRRSKRARNPLVIIGNAIFTLLIVVALGAGGAIAFGKHRFESPGPLDEDKTVNIPSRLGLVEIADLLRKEGVMEESNAIFLGGVFALKARTDIKSGEYLFPEARERARRRRDHGRRQSRAASAHDPGGPDLGADRRAAARQRHLSAVTSRKCRVRARCCRKAIASRAARRAIR